MFSKYEVSPAMPVIWHDRHMWGMSLTEVGLARSSTFSERLGRTVICYYASKHQPEDTEQWGTQKINQSFRSALSEHLMKINEFRGSLAGLVFYELRVFLPY